MNILFLTMSQQLQNISAHGIYTDLVRKFRDEGHDVYVMAPYERRTGRKTCLLKVDGVNILGVKTLNVQKTNIVEKGLGQIMLERQFKAAFRKYLNNVKFDVIMYSTPPITFTNVIKYVKKLNPNVITYLMLKDIFPQNAVDINMLKKSGIKGLLYKSFRKKEKEMYRISDYIGCMSPANVKYVIKHNPEVNPEIVEICPNSMEPINDGSQTLEERNAIREKYGLPLEKTIFFYGGNLGKPQGIPFLIECLMANRHRDDCHFIIVGNGTEYKKVETFMQMEQPANVSLFYRLSKEDYDHLANACDVGLIFLDYRFTIPNYPSRLLACLMQKKPIIACTDPNCDTGVIANENGYGLWVPSNSVDAFTNAINKMLSSDIKVMGEKGYQFYLNHYTVQHSYDAIMKHIN